MTFSLRALRVNQGYSQLELSKKLGVSQTTVSAWERGDAEPSSRNIYKLAKLYAVEPTVIFDTLFEQKT